MFERSLRLISFTRATNHFFPSYTFQGGLKMPETFRTRTSLLHSSRTLVNPLTQTTHSHVCTHSLSPPPAHTQTHTHTPRTHTIHSVRVRERNRTTRRRRRGDNRKEEEESQRRGGSQCVRLERIGCCSLWRSQLLLASLLRGLGR